MQDDLSGPRRYELKYTITEALARRIRAHIRPFFSPDRHADVDGCYTVNNVYFDTPDLRFYQDVQLKQETRLKPRVRYYGRQPEGLIVLEVKHRHNTISWKQRTPFEAGDWPALLETPPGASRPDTFVETVPLYGAVPILHVRYRREPYVSDIDAYGRVTFDRGMRYRLARGDHSLWVNDGAMAYYDDPVNARSPDSPVVLEIKTETFVPSWAVDLVRRFSLMQRGYSKYCYAVDCCLKSGMAPSELAF